MMRPQDAAAAARLGVDAIGMVFYSPAPRCVTMDQAKEIMQALPPFVTPVGLFVDSGEDEIRETAGRLGLRHVQLHGHESPELVASLKDMRIIKVIKVDELRLIETLSAWRRAIEQLKLSNLAGLLLETAGTSAPGGTGVENNWSAIAAAQAAGAFAGLPPLIAAGGLNPDNVAPVVQRLHPWAVDVSSGVESSRGIKSEEKMAAFIKAVSA